LILIAVAKAISLASSPRLIASAVSASLGPIFGPRSPSCEAGLAVLGQVQGFLFIQYSFVPVVAIAFLMILSSSCSGRDDLTPTDEITSGGVLHLFWACKPWPSSSRFCIGMTLCAIATNSIFSGSSV